MVLSVKMRKLALTAASLSAARRMRSATQGTSPHCKKSAYAAREEVYAWRLMNVSGNPGYQGHRDRSYDSRVMRPLRNIRRSRLDTNVLKVVVPDIGARGRRPSERALGIRQGAVFKGRFVWEPLLAGINGVHEHARPS